MISVGGRKLFITLSAHQLRLAGAFRHLASLERLVPPSRLHMCYLQWYLLTLWSPESYHPSLPVPLSRAIRWISLRGWCGTVFSTGFSIRVSGSDSAPMFGRVYVGVRRAPPRSFLCPQCVRNESCCSTSIFSD